MLDRFNIINEADPAAAVAKRFGGANGNPAANATPAEKPTDSLSSSAS